MAISKIKVIAVCKDGGTRHIQYGQSQYYVDYRVGSETRGSIYDDYPTRGKRVDPVIEKEIQAELMRDILR